MFVMLELISENHENVVDRKKLKSPSHYEDRSDKNKKLTYRIRCVEEQRS